MDDIVIVESKDYAQVLFDDVQECYMENKDLTCHFTLNEFLEIDKSDFIGVFKVGFTKPKEHVLAMNVDLSLIQQQQDDSQGNTGNKGKLVFSGEKLPKDDGEFYQFVYMSLGKQIRGASIPFQFKRTHLSDYVEVDEQEAVVFKLKESEIKETLTEIKQKCLNLSQANDTYERLVKENDESIRMLKDELTTVKMRCLRLTMENDKFNSTMSKTIENNKAINDQLTTLTDENHKLREKFDYLSNENKNLVDLLQRRITQVESLKQELENVRATSGENECLLKAKETELTELRRERDELKNMSCNLKKNSENLNKLERQVDEHVDELNRIKVDLKRQEQTVNEQTQTIQTILAERDSLNALIETLTKEKSDLEAARDTISQELLMSKDKLAAVEQCKEILRAQLAIANSELESTHARLKYVDEELARLTDKDMTYESEKSDMIERIKHMKSDYESKIQQANGAYFALNLAHMHLENRMKLHQNRFDKESVEHKDLIETLKTENENLKQRIRAGACEYALLNNKYLKLRNAFRMSKSMSSSSMFGSQCTQNDQDKFEEIDSVLEDRTVSEAGSAQTTKTTTAERSSVNNEQQFDNTTIIDDMSLRSSFYSLTKLQNKQQQLDDDYDEDLDASLNAMSRPLLTGRAAPRGKTSTLTTTTTTPSQLLGRAAFRGKATHQDTNSDEHHNSPSTFHPIKRGGSCLMSRLDLIHDLDNMKLTDDSSVAIELVEHQNDSNNNMVLNNQTIDITQDCSECDCSGAKRASLMDNGSCEICGYVFPTDLDVFAYEMHMSSHYGPSCPVCFFTFRKGYPQNDFESHVNSHFTN